MKENIEQLEKDLEKLQETLYFETDDHKIEGYYAEARELEERLKNAKAEK